MKSDNHALVFGSSGLAGWGVTNTLLSGYPTPNTFKKVTAVVNRPMTVAEASWDSKLDSIELQLVSGVDLTKGNEEEIDRLLNAKVPDLESVTHVFYFAYKEHGGGDEERIINSMMLRRLVASLNKCCPSLSFLVFPSGLKAYGLQFPDYKISTPLTEADAQLPEELAKTLHYAEFRRILQEASLNRNWSWCEVIPEAIIGFTPNGSTFNITAHWGNYLATIALVEPRGTKVPFPGDLKSYDAKFNEVSANTIGRQSIFLALNPKVSSGRAFNVADRSEPSTLSILWPQLASYFGLKGVEPLPDAKDHLMPSEYVKKHEHILKAHLKRPSEVFKSDFLDQYGWWQVRDRHFSMERTRAAGFVEECDPAESWRSAFDKFEKEGMLPP